MGLCMRGLLTGEPRFNMGFYVGVLKCKNSLISSKHNISTSQFTCLLGNTLTILFSTVSV